MLDGDVVDITTWDGASVVTKSYDPDCPCFDGANSNTGAVPLPFEGGGGGSPTPQPTPQPTPAPAPPTTAPPSTPGQRKNVLLFMPDDLHYLWDDGPASPSGRTFNSDAVPNMNRIRSEGVVFTQAYVAGPKCAPSRFNVLTGRYCSRSTFARAHSSSSDSEVVNVEVPQCKIDGSDLALTTQRTLRDNGFATIMAGKWHVAAGGSWGDYPAAVGLVNDTGFTDPAAVYIGNLDTSLAFSHNHEWLTAEANAGMEASVTAGSPFFLYFTPTAPHTPDVYDSLTAFTLLDTPGGTLASPPDSNFAMTRAEIQSYVQANVNNVERQGSNKAGEVVCDLALGSLMAKMQALGILDETLIIVTQDHGQSAKSTLYEGGVRVALMARLPGVIAAGSTVTHPVNNLDLGPTILEMAGIARPYALDGRSWWAAATTGTPSAEHAARACVVSEILVDRAVVCPGLGLKLIRKLSDPAVVPGDPSFPASNDTIQLYDLALDPTEQTNLASNAAHDESRLLLLAYLDCHQTDTAKTNPTACDPEALLGVTRSPTPAPTPAPINSGPTPPPTRYAYCPEGYGDYGVRNNWALGRVTIVSSHEECAARCTLYSAPQFSGGCKGYQTGMYFGMLFCRSYGGNLRTTGCAPWAVPTDSGMGSGALGVVHPQTNQVNVGGNCCTNTTFVVAEQAFADGGGG